MSAIRKSRLESSIMLGKPAKRHLVGVAFVILTFAAVYISLRSFDASTACTSEAETVIPDLDGVGVEVTYTNCDTLAKDESISVYLSRSANKKDSWFARWRNHRALVFRYDPGRYDNPLPSITRPSLSTILISVPEVSSIMYQSRKWQDVSVGYQIGKVYYPAPPKQTSR